VTTIFGISFTLGGVLPVPFNNPPSGLAFEARALLRQIGPVDEK
jgi:hypothetical protein